jgi:outer membrane protein assembly factor BamB
VTKTTATTRSSRPTTRRRARKSGRRSARSKSAGARPSSSTWTVTNGSERIIAYDPATGKELWRTKGVESNAIHTPLVGHGVVIVTAGFPVKRVLAIRPGNVPDDARVAWEYLKGTGYVLSNMLYRDYVYLLTDNGIVTCLDPKTGEVKYEGGRVPVPARFMGSPVAYAGFVAMTSEDGDTYMLKAGSSHEIVRTNSVDEPVLSSPAIANGRIYIRGQKHLFAIGR